MTALRLSAREELLLNAALNPDRAVAVGSWENWRSQIPLEEAPYPELRLLPAVHAHLSRIAPDHSLPNKLRGKARATFTLNKLLAHGSLPVIAELNQHCPVILAKGAAVCIRFDAWASRAMGDIDIHVPLLCLEKACEVFAGSGWTPKYGMTWASLAHRSSLRRDSWNITKGHLDLDIHWRFKEGDAAEWLDTAMWSSAERMDFGGQSLALQSPEFAFAASLSHGFEGGTRADAFQTIVDSVSWLPVCRLSLLSDLLHRARLMPRFRTLASILQKVGLSEIISEVPASAPVMSRGGEIAREETAIRNPLRLWTLPPRKETETGLLRHPTLYRLWEAGGRKPIVERLMLRLWGPLSRPLADATGYEEDYDLRDCDVIDRIGGPGWGWPEPEHTCFWTDRADARLLIPLSHVGDFLIVFGLADNRLDSPNAMVDIFVNGREARTIDQREGTRASQYCVLIPKRYLYGPWVELSLRPKAYRGENSIPADARLMRSVPARSLRVRSMERASEVLSANNIPQIAWSLLEGQEPNTSKFERIKTKMRNSAYRNSNELPPGFDPLAYVLYYPDLFAHEVDPYEHYLLAGKRENRVWR
jgi:hypothetical protein